MKFKTRRSYSAPTLYLLGGGSEGMDTSSRSDLPPTRAAMAENLWREGDCLCKRPGVKLLEQLDISGRVQWMKRFGGYRYFFYIGEQGGVLRREKRGLYEERPAENAVFLEKDGWLFIFFSGGWIVIHEQNTTLFSPEGSVSLSYSFAAAPRAWDMVTGSILAPLIRAGSRPHKAGVGVKAPNLLVPFVKESFVYTKSDRDAKRNRFCLAFSPQVKGELPTNADGTHTDLSNADSAVRVATLNASAWLEARLEDTDAYGNITDRWVTLTWTAADNINSADAAVWVQSVHTLGLSFDGDDNIRITYFQPELEDTQRLYNAKVFALFGVDGRKDRIFAAAGDRLFYSDLEGGYFGSVQYVDLGEEILLLSGEEGVLTALSAEGAWRITGHAESKLGEYATDAFFSVSARFPSPRPYGESIIAGSELFFYSERGLCAVAPSGVMDERNVQLRSERLWGILEKEDPAAIRLGVWEDWLLMAGERGICLLDLSRRAKSEEPYSSHCYEGYFWSIGGVECFAEEGQFIKDGALYGFLKGQSFDEVSVGGESERRPIAAVWETVPLGEPFRCGTFTGLNLFMEGPTMVKVSVWDGKQWKVLYGYDGRFFPFRYATFRYDAFSYTTLWRGVWRYPLRLRHRRQLRLRFENDLIDCDFKMRQFTAEYK